MTLQPIDGIRSVRSTPISERASELIDDANERIEAFMLADEDVIEDFVTCDFHLFDQTLSWLKQKGMLAGDRFCELGSGIAAVSLLAAMQGMESVGIEIQPVLVAESRALAEATNVPARFYCGSYVPDEAARHPELVDFAEFTEGVSRQTFHEAVPSWGSFDLLFVYPWPREQPFFEALFDAFAAEGAIMMIYRGRHGMKVVRKV